MSQQPDFAQIRRNIAGYSDDQLIDVVELAALLATTPGMIYRYLYSNPSALPPTMAGFGRKRVWRLGTCRDWLRQRAGLDAKPVSNAPKSKRIGRPRSTDTAPTPSR